MESKAGNIITPVGRASYPNLFRARKNEMSGKDEFSVTLLFKKGEDLSGLKKLAHEAAVKKFGADPKKWPKPFRTPFRDQADKAKENEKGELVLPEGYESGAFYINLKSDRAPGIVGPDRQAIIDENEVYAGCYIRCSIRAFAYDTKGNRGVSFGLINVQKVKDGEPLGNRVKAEDEFAAIEGAAGDSDEAGLGASDSIFG